MNRGRRIDDPPGVRSRQLSGFDDVALRHLSPPRVRIEHAVLTVASSAPTDDAAIAILADVCQQHRTTAGRLAAALRHRTRLRRRTVLLALLDDISTGAYSVLEQRYLAQVERRHGLPTGSRQRRVTAGGRPAYRDVEYVGHALVVELDGRLGHERAGDRWADLDRDIAATIDGRITLRLSWRQVLDPCRSALAVSSLLRARGWRGRPHACGPACAIRNGNRGGSSAAGAGEPPLSAA